MNNFKVGDNIIVMYPKGYNVNENEGRYGAYFKCWVGKIIDIRGETFDVDFYLNGDDKEINYNDYSVDKSECVLYGE